MRNKPSNSTDGTQDLLSSLEAALLLYAQEETLTETERAESCVLLAHLAILVSQTALDQASVVASVHSEEVATEEEGSNPSIALVEPLVAEGDEEGGNDEFVGTVTGELAGQASVVVSVHSEEVSVSSEEEEEEDESVGTQVTDAGLHQAPQDLHAPEHVPAVAEDDPAVGAAEPETGPDEAIEFVPRMLYHSTQVRALDGTIVGVGPGYVAPNTYQAAGSGRVYDTRRTPPGTCFNCYGRHWRIHCPYAVGNSSLQ